MQAGQDAIGARPRSRQRGERPLGLVGVPGVEQAQRIGERVAARCGFLRAASLIVFVAADDGEHDEGGDDEIDAVGLEEIGGLLATILFVDLADESSLHQPWRFCLKSLSL